MPKKTGRKLFVDIPYKDLDAAMFADLVESEHRFRRLAELTNDLIIQTDTNGRIVYATPSIKNILGYEADAVQGKDVLDFLYVADRAMAERVIKDLYETSKPSRTIGRMLKKDGSFIWVEAVAQLATDDKGEIIGTFAAVRDIHTSQLALQKLYKKERELKTFRAAVESAFNHVVFTNPDGKIIYANEGMTRVTGYSIDEAIGQTPALWGKQMPPEFYKVFWEQIKDKKQAFHGEIINKRKNGELYRAIATVSPILESGEIIGFIGIEEDISAYKPPEAGEL